MGRKKLSPSNRRTPHTILTDHDLSETQVYITYQSYDRSAHHYAATWEDDPVTIAEIKKYNINPFLKFTKPGQNLLLVNCQTGRDYELLTKAGYVCLGTDSSYGLLTEAISRVPTGLFLHSDPRELPFLPNSFDGVYANALSHVPKRDIKDTLRDFRIFLRPGGILYLALKVGKKGILQLSEASGDKYYTLYTKKEIDDLISITGFKPIWSATSPHTDTSLPGWYSLIAKKSQ